MSQLSQLSQLSQPNINLILPQIKGKQNTCPNCLNCHNSHNPTTDLYPLSKMSQLSRPNPLLKNPQKLPSPSPHMILSKQKASPPIRIRKPKESQHTIRTLLRRIRNRRHLPPLARSHHH